LIINFLVAVMTSMSTDDVYYVDAMREILSGEPCHGVVTEPTRLLDHVFIGSQSNAEDLRTLRRLGVTHVLNCAGYKGPRPFPNASPYEGLGIDYYEFMAEDSDRYDITRHFPESFRYLDAVKRSGGTALVHCALGINRSAAVCLAYMMVDRRLPLLAATRIIKDKRRIVLANKTFQRQLVRFARLRSLLDDVGSKPGAGQTLTQDGLRGGHERRWRATADGRTSTGWRTDVARDDDRDLLDMRLNGLRFGVDRTGYGSRMLADAETSYQWRAKEDDPARLDKGQAATGYYDTVVVEKRHPRTSTSNSVVANGDAVHRSRDYGKMADYQINGWSTASTASTDGRYYRTTGSAISLPRMMPSVGKQHVRSRSTSGIRC